VNTRLSINKRWRGILGTGKGQLDIRKDYSLSFRYRCHFW